MSKSKTCGPAPRAINEGNAAKYIGLGRSTLKEARLHGARKGRINPPPFLRLGNEIRYLIEDLDAWLMAHRVEVRHE